MKQVVLQLIWLFRSPYILSALYSSGIYLMLAHKAYHFGEVKAKQQIFSYREPRKIKNFTLTEAYKKNALRHQRV
jgi:hypothetical protein